MISSIYENCIEILWVLVNQGLKINLNLKINWLNIHNQFKNPERHIILEMYLKVNTNL